MKYFIKKLRDLRYKQHLYRILPFSFLPKVQALVFSMMRYSLHPCCQLCKSRKRRLGQAMKSPPPPKVKLCGLISPAQNSNSLSRICTNWFKRINFKLILLNLLFKSLLFKISLNCSYVLLIYIFSIITQWVSIKNVFIKKDKRVISLINLHLLTENLVPLKHLALSLLSKECLLPPSTITKLNSC